MRYYVSNHRDLPWRRTRDPYRIWLSEVMLQQTRVATIVERYERFLSVFPDVGSLAAATVERVFEEWAGLGYYSRARNLHAAACRIVSSHGGQLPGTAAALATLPGVGRYTAGAVASIAFGEVAPAVDGNVARVLSRLYAIDEAPNSGAATRRLSMHAARLAACDRPGDLNQALMELGAMICTPRTPECGSCPVRRFCAAHAQGDPVRYPKRSPSRAPRPTLRVSFLWHRSRSGVWLEQRPAHGLWAGQWQLPGEDGPTSRERLALRFSVPLTRRIARVRHELTHRIVIASVYAPPATADVRRRSKIRRFADPLSAPLSGVARRAVEAVIRSGA